MSKIAHIVAIKAESLKSEGDLGFGILACPSSIDYTLDQSEVWIGPRQVLETDFDFVQPIPYIVVRDGDRVLAYERGAGGGDSRLFSKVSIGFGGHVDLADAVTNDQGVIDLRATMAKACARELEEELGISLAGMMPEQIDAMFDWTHIISSDASAVDEVHIGLVAMIDVAQLPGIDPARFESVIENARWVDHHGLVTDAAAGVLTLESWTALVLSLPFDRAA